jgi:hypothetical protein
MSDASYVVQKVDWFQLRTPEGKAIMVMVAGLPNGYYTAVPVEVSMRLAAHGMMALAASPEDALTQLQATLSGKGPEEIFPQGHD